MAKEKLEEYEEEYEEYEEIEEEEVDEEVDLLTMYKQNIIELNKRRKQYEPETEEYAILTNRIEAETENYRRAEEAATERSQRILNDKSRYNGVWQIASNFVANFGGQLVGSLLNRKNVKTVVDCEKDGGIIRTQATKFIK